MNYRIIGADGKTYGPVTAEQIRAWISDGRVESRTAVFADGAADWTFAGLLPEFADLFFTPPPVITAIPPGNGQHTNGFAIASLICGILSLTCCCGCPFNILAIVFSIIALVQIKADPSQAGHGMAVAGLVCGIAGFLLGLALGIFQVLLSSAATFH